ncbi:MAG TPA: FAD-dependent oxidoreductase [Atribacteraceae bacterium]|nr:FAD-dependent oxidoreductase [Atribacteraceae bacterium]
MNREKTKYLLIGFSVAAWFAARAIREVDWNGRILAVSDEEKAYSRPLLSYALGQGSRGIAYNGDALQRADVDILWGKRVSSLDLAGRTAILANGDEVEFDKGLIATGGVPVLPAFSGMDSPGVFTFTRVRDLDEVDRFIHRNQIQKVVILGGGFIGLKTAEALLGRELELSIVELAPRLLGNMVDKEGSALLEKALRNHDLEVILEDTIERFESDQGRLSAVMLRSGRRIPSELAVIAIGIRPNVDWLKHTGLEIDRGVVVDTHQETSVPGIFAAGDVAETTHFLTGERVVSAVWPEAVAQGKVAGWNMAGRETEYAGSLPVNALEVGELPLISAGIVSPDGVGFETLVRRRGGVYQKLVLAGDRVVGLIFVGEIEKAGIYLNLIRQRFPVDTFREKLLDPKFGIINLPFNFRKHMVEGAGIEV